MKIKFTGLLTLFLALAVQFSFAQTKEVTGTVTDGSGVPLPGVNIVIQGTTTGTQTDFDGNYAISASEGQTLVFSATQLLLALVLQSDHTQDRCCQSSLSADPDQCRLHW